ncbi:MAG TPA: 23S rRNA (uracil(1939)-C(5))-methyltransferase RlmD [Gammaproteobacteria bacterium]|nr:23S rRNA (uracil(1939)-C(5))-methyltransferase RlmD [Gammaproteobacteria bacterium]
MAIEISITNLSHDGRGVGHLNGKAVFIDGALPDEVVLAEITKKHSRFNHARLIEVIKASPDRVVAKCSHFDICGGCQLQHLDPEKQILLKQDNLLNQLKHMGQVEPNEILPPLTGPLWGYRSKARLSVKYVEKKQKLMIGFHEKMGRYIADLDHCEVLDPRVGTKFELLRAMISSLSIYKQLPQIEVACDKDNVALIFRHLAPVTESDKNILTQFGKEHNFQIYLHPNKPEPISVMADLSYTFEDITYKFNPQDFTQINPEINQKMLTLALHLLDLKPEDNVLDLFCGLGNFTLPIAKRCAHVMGIEGDKNMVLKARKNAELNNITNIAFGFSNLFEPDNSLPWMQKKYDKVLLDPPRTGAIEILPMVTKWQPKIIVYVSCNPATLARDAGELVHKYGYKLIKAGVMDMFPHTKHVESIAVFTKG